MTTPATMDLEDLRGKTAVEVTQWSATGIFAGWLTYLDGKQLTELEKFLATLPDQTPGNCEEFSLTYYSGEDGDTLREWVLDEPAGQKVLDHLGLSEKAATYR